MDDSGARLPSDEELACRAQSGCAASFDELVRRWQVPVVHFLQHRVDAADVEDLAQETFLRVYENLGRYRPRWHFKTWLMTIARRLSINHHQRSRPPMLGDAALESLPDETAGPAEVAMASEGRQLLWTAASAVLSEAQMTAMWLHYAEQMSVSQVARVLGRSRVAVKALMFRARQKLLPVLERLEVDGMAGGQDQSTGAASGGSVVCEGVSHV